MIYLKLILACLLSAMPFLYVSFVKPKRETSPRWRNMFTAIASQMTRMNAVKRTCNNFMRRIYIGMKFSDNFRKFFMLLTLMMMIAVQFIDFSASTQIAKEMMNTADNATTNPEHTTQMANILYICAPLMTMPHATLLAAAFSLILFVYKPADWLLTTLHNHQRFFFFIALADITLLFASPRFLIVVVEMVEIILMAALIYPNKIIPPDPKQRKDIPEEKQIMEFIKDVA